MGAERKSWAGLALAALIFVAGCGGQDRTSPSPPPTATVTLQADAETTVPEAADQASPPTDPQSLRVESVRGELRPGMQLLLCSDGLTEEVKDTAIAAIVGRTELSAQECVDHLILAALDGGGSDNVTVILVRAR